MTSQSSLDFHAEEPGATESERDSRVYALSIFRNKRSTRPDTRQLTWPEICTLLEKRRQSEEKDGVAFSPVTLTEGSTRRAENVESVSTLVIDLDGVGYDQVAESLAPYAHAAYTTHSHMSDKGERWRIVVPLSANVPGSDWSEFYVDACRYLIGEGWDLSCKDACRLHYLPSCPPAFLEFARFRSMDGPLLDPGQIPRLPRISQTIQPNGEMVTGLQAVLTGDLTDGQKHAQIRDAIFKMRKDGYSKDVATAVIRCCIYELDQSRLNEPRVDVITKYVRDIEHVWSCESVAPLLRPTRKALWPTPIPLSDYFGLAGDFVRAIDPETESDPVAVYVQILVIFGNFVGRGAFHVIEGKRHFPNLYALITGATGDGRKGTSFDQAAGVFERAIDGWSLKSWVRSGLGSGEGIIHHVRDERYERTFDENGEERETIVDAGVKEKRFLGCEAEFAHLLETMSRQGNTLSPVIRNGWDSKPLETVTKRAPERCAEPHLSLVGHITPTELSQKLQTTEVANGFMNRWLVLLVKKSKSQPHGGNLENVDFGELNRQLQQAVTFAQSIGEVKLDERARAYWETVYEPLGEARTGMVGEMVARATAHVKRLALVFALLDCSFAIKREHLAAAMQLWAYVEASIEILFDGRTGTPVADSILRRLQESPGGLTRTEINDLLGGKVRSSLIDEALDRLLESDLVRFRRELTKGPPKTTWFAREHFIEEAE